MDLMKRIMRLSAYLIGAMACLSAAAQELDWRGTLLVDGAAIPKSSRIASGVAVSSEIDPASVDKGVRAFLLYPVTGSLAVGVGSGFDDRLSLDPAPSIRYQLLSQAVSGVDLTAVARYKTVGFFAGDEVQTGVAIGRHWRQLDVALNAAIGRAVHSDGNMDVETAVSVGWRLDDKTRVSLDARLRGDLADNAESAAHPDVRNFDLLAGPSMSCRLGLVQLQALIGLFAPKTAQAPGPAAMGIASFDL